MRNQKKVFREQLEAVTGKKEERTQTVFACCVCGKIMEKGVYGWWDGGKKGVCSKNCNNTMENKRHEIYSSPKENIA